MARAFLTRGDTPADGKEHCVAKPCAECPYSKSVTPGLTGGTGPQVYVGQAFGPFWLPCHMAKGYDENPSDHRLPQCAGAAMFRANCGYDEHLEHLTFLHRLGPGPEAFGSPAELISHHARVPLELAEAFLRDNPPDHLAVVEMEKARAKIARGGL
jgi:hypothetical protein